MLSHTSKTAAPRPAGVGLIAVQLAVIAMVSLVFKAYDSVALSSDSLVYLASVSSLALSAWLIWSWKRASGSFFDPYALFLFAAMLFNQGQVFLEVLGLNSTGLLAGMFSLDTTLSTIFLVMLGLASFHAGALLSVIASRTSPSEYPATPVADLRLVGWSLIAISLVPTIFVLGEAVSTVMSGGYSGLYQRDTTTGFGAAYKILASFLVPGTLFLLAGSKGRRAELLVSAALIAVYTMLQFFLGARSKAALPLIAYVWLWHSCVRPLPRTVLLLGGSAMLLIVFPLVKAVRNVSGAERSSLSTFRELYLSIDNPVVAIVSEMGGSMATVAYTLDLVPSFRAFDMGAGYFYALLTVVPNLFWDIHPTIKRGLPSDWLTWTVDPYIAAQGGGLGFSFIAEAYLNFGWFGSLIALGVIGFLFGRLTLWAVRSADPARLAMIASFIAFFLFYVRQESASQVRSLLWYSFAPYLCVRAVGLFRGNKNKQGRYL